MVQTVSPDFRAIAEKTKRTVETAFHEVTQDVAEALIPATPVRTGFLRGSWFPSINTKDSTFEGTFDKSGAQTIARIALEIQTSKIGDVFYILNGANYAKFVEYGTSRMAPRAFVRGTVNRLPQIVNRTIERIKVR